MVQPAHRLFTVLVVLAGALLLPAASSTAAPPPLAASVVGEAPSGGGVLRFPQGVAVDPHDGTVFVGDQYSGIVQAFTPAGQFKFSFGSLASRGEPGRFNVVGGVAVDRTRHVYVLDSDQDRVEVFSARTGAYITSFGDSSMLHVFAGSKRVDHGITAGGIAVFQDGHGGPPNVYVADAGNNRVAKFVLNGALQPVAPPLSTSGIRKLSWPQGVVTDPTGRRVYVADDKNHRVVVFDSTTMTPLDTVGVQGTGPGQFNAPYDVAVDAAVPNRLYVADNLNGRVNAFDASSLEFVGTYGGNGHHVGQFSIVRAVAASVRSKLGGVVVADTANNRLQTLDRDGNITSAWGVAGRSNGYFTRPSGVSIGPDGTIAVTDRFDHRIELLAPDGTYVGQYNAPSKTGFAAPGAGVGRYLLPEDGEYNPDGSMWVSDTGNDRLVLLNAQGGVALITTDDQIVKPHGLATAPDGSAYVADSAQGAVIKLGQDGSATTIRSNLNGPTDVAWANNRIWVSTGTNISDAVSGAKIAPPPDEKAWDHPQAIRFAADGTLYVSESRPKVPNGARVLRGTPSADGKTYSWDTIAGEGSGPGQVIDPAGLALSADGQTLFVADSGNNRVLRFDPPGYVAPDVPLLTTTIEGGLTRGAITSGPGGIDCGTDCFQHIGAGRQIVLTATAFEGSAFLGWTGACAASGTAPMCTVTMDGAVTAGASFGPIPPPPARIMAVKVTPTLWHRGRKADKRRHLKLRNATRAQIVVRMNQPAKVTLTLLVAKPGRKSGTTCVAPKAGRAVPKKQQCTRFAPRAGARKLQLAKGRTVIPQTTHFANKPMLPGTYAFRLDSRDITGNTSTKTTNSFRITP